MATLWLKLLYFFIIFASYCHGESNTSIPEENLLPEVSSLEFQKTTLPPNTHDWSYEKGAKHVDYSPGNDTQCRLRPTDPRMHDKIIRLIERQAKLIEIQLVIANHTENPLLRDPKWVYQGNVWARVVHPHAITILTLTFNYGVMSLMTLTFGVDSVEVELAEEPFGCLNNMSEKTRMRPVLDILLRDFKPEGPLSVSEGQGVCHQVIRNVGGYAKFDDQCCFLVPDTGKIHCPIDLPNVWLEILSILLSIFVIIVFLFGPLLATSSLYMHSLDIEKYIVKLEKPLYKTLCFCRGTLNKAIHANNFIDIRGKDGFNKCKKKLEMLPTDTVIPIKINEMHILVNYNKLLPENQVPVGVFRSLYRAVFRCHLRDLHPFHQCCQANSLKFFQNSYPLPWANICRIVGRILLVFFLLIPFYIRLVLYFLFEDPEVQLRKSAAEKVDLTIWFSFKILQYLTPTHPLFIFVYVLFFVSGLSLACMSALRKSSRFQQVIRDSMKDLFDLSWFDGLGVIVNNFLWPFAKFGFLGIFVGLVYWPIIMPITILACGVYCTPIIYLSIRIVHHSLELPTKAKYNTEDVPLTCNDEHDMYRLETDNLFLQAKTSCSDQTKGKSVQALTKVKPLRMVYNIVLAILCIATLFCIMVLVTECASFVLRMCVFTMMGVIVNAGQVLKYGMLIGLVVIHSYDSYNIVYKKYLKFNKSLFSKIKPKIKDLDLVTNLPSHIQQNRAFQANESETQEKFEHADNMATDLGGRWKDLNGRWKINDLILFVDNDDTPRIPRKLFERACSIKVSGSPGPVYLSLLYATRRFIVIVSFLIFVFIVVLSFGNLYQVSNTNQILATMAGGFIPFIFSNFLKPSAPPLELGTVSFGSKLDQIITQFWQMWPMIDFPFEIKENSDEDSASQHDLEVREDVSNPEEMKPSRGLAHINPERSALNELVDICILLEDEDANEALNAEGFHLTGNGGTII